MKKCRSVHKATGRACHRPKGHLGLCWSKWWSMKRAEWLSVKGAYIIHSHYRFLGGLVKRFDPDP